MALATAWCPAGASVAAAAGEEYTLLVLANEARAANNVPPLAWNDDLADAALAHSEDLASHGGNCPDLHNSCNGQIWWKRVQSYYPNWTALGENVAESIDDAQTLHDGWMASDGHRANILSSSFTEFGAGIALGQTNFGMLAFATEDFGSRGLLSSSAYPALPAGSVEPLEGGTETRDLQVTYYDSAGGAPKAIRALVGSSCVDLKLKSGKVAYGTYGVSRSFSGSGCVPVVFEVIRPDGTAAHFPTSDALLVGVGAAGAYCAERTTAVPTQDCGGGSTPTPTPTPTPRGAPTPTPNGSQVSGLNVSLKPGKTNASRGIVQIQATLPSLSGFDPTTGPVSIHVSFEPSGDWSRTLPQACGSKPCLTLNKRGTAYHASYDSKTTLNLTRGKSSSRWTLHFTARGQSLGTVDAGTVTTTISIGGKTFAGSADGALKQSGLFAH